MKIVRSLLVLALSMVLATSAGRATTWENDLLNVQFQIPPPTVVFNGNFTVPASGIDFIGNGELLLNIGESLVQLVNVTNALLVFDSSAIVKITDTTASRIENVQVDPSSTIPLLGSLISGNNFLQFDLSDAQIVPNGVLNLQVSFLDTLAIPEPGPLPVFASALVGLLSVWWMSSRRGRGRSTRATAIRPDTCFNSAGAG